ncbi:S8 family serine peptidase [Fulvivirgaceae bacterium BMA10]|uniref:S8 family serine peptidase n=1 Tax=Splendidivirga corallicola TaxID=3051826 RepID=A0ABT8KYV3_9BACT|nr:S8 family serine peptidase [Fulvivirgaceae bacterium BMA10]
MNNKPLRWKIVLLVFLLSGTVSFAQTPFEKAQIARQYDQVKLSQLQNQLARKAALNKAQALQMAAQRGWEIRKVNLDGSYDELMAVSSDGHPIYYTLFNVNAAKSTRADQLNSGGSLGLTLDGQNMTAHVWDGGPTRPTHQEFDGPGGNNRVTINDGVTTLNNNSFHAQHVTGTIVASGVNANAKGMAPQAKALTHDWDTDLSEAATEAANGMLLSNHSYGFRADLVPDWYFGAYIGESRDWDDLMYNSPFYLMVVAAGNDGNDNTSNGNPLNGNSSYDKLTGHSTSKNNLVVANGQDANVTSDGTLNSVTINSGSSEGPTDDLRIKPDITGNGTQLFSTFHNSDVAYNTISGTSMAAPNVTGTLLLLQQHYNNVNGGFMRAATLKGLALHTADDAGPSGPDAVYGWGLLNGKAAAQAISQNGNESKVEELTLSPGQTYTVDVTSDGVNPLLASISWTDPAGTANTGTANLTTPVLVNDLDIRVTQNTSTFEPHKLTGVNTNTTGDNNVDPFERVDVAGASGTYTITVTHKGSLTGGSQNYTLIVTGLSGQAVACNTPTGLSSSNIAETSFTLSWNAVTGALSYDVDIDGTVTNTTATSMNVTGLTASTTYNAKVRAVCASATSAYSATIQVTTSGPGGLDCPNTISVFPYTESFESDIGVWNQPTGDDGDWVRDSGGTPSNGTGPSTGADGSFYMFIEASNNSSLGAIGYPDKVAIFESPCLDLSSETSANFIFDYHMNGTAMGTLNLDVTTDGSNWTNLWTRSGSQGNAWIEETIDLASYLGQTIKLRFHGTTGSSWSSDMAIDDIEVTTGAVATCDVPTGLASSNIGETSFTLTWNAVTGAVSYDVDVDGTVTNTTSTSTNITGLTASTTYNAKVRAVCASATSAYSSTIQVTTLDPSGLDCPNTVSSFPYSESFESGIGVWNQPTGDDGNWVRDSGGTPSNGTGPSTGADGSFYMFIEASNNNSTGAIGYPNKVAIFESPCIDLSGETAASFIFNYHMNGTSMGTLNLDVTTDDTNWTNLWTRSGSQGNSWNQETIDLASYIGQTIKLRFHGTTGSSWSSDMAIDNVQITTGNTITYCSASSNGCGTYEYISNVAIGSIDHGTNCSSGGYEDNTGISTDLSGSQSLTITIGRPDAADQVGAWIDWNQDGDFNDANESISVTFSGSAGTGTVTVPSGAASGATRMRVRVNYNAAAPACGNTTYGETEDYTVNVITSVAANYITSTIDHVSGFTTYPNPAKQELNINLPADAIKSLKVFSLNGAEIKNIRTYQNKVDVSRLQSGVYLISVVTDQGVYQNTFIKEQ